MNIHRRSLRYSCRKQYTTAGTSTAKAAPVDFNSTVIVITSNRGSARVAALCDQNGEEWEIEATLREVLKQFFCPEFLDRIDEAIVFHPHGRVKIERIVAVQLERLRAGLAARRVTLLLTPAAFKRLAEEGTPRL